MRSLIAFIVAIAILAGTAGSADPAIAAPWLPPGGTFNDDDASVHEGAIEAIRDAGITVGCNPPESDRYCPDQVVSRAEMASFLTRAFDLPAVDSDFFIDDASSIHQADINAVASAGITLGCNPPSNNEFCPADPVTREQVASFFVRAMRLPSSAIDVFDDDSASVHEGDINAFAAAGLTRGCNPPDGDAYCPAAPLTRAEMASFLQRSLGLPFLEVPDPLPEASPSPLVVIGNDKWLYYRPTVAQACIASEVHGEAVTEIDRIRTIVESSGREFYFVVVPDKASIHPEGIPADLEASSCRLDNTLNFRAALAAHPTADPITMWEPLSVVAESRLLYFKHDTHWNGEGALEGAGIIARALAESTWNTATTVPNATTRSGDLAGFIGINWIEDFVDYSTALPGASTDVQVEAAAYNGRAIVSYQTVGAADPRTVVVFHDSFGYFFQNKLGPLFSSVSFIPAFEYPGEDTSVFTAGADIIVIAIAERNATAELTSGDLSDYLEKMLAP